MKKDYAEMVTRLLTTDDVITLRSAEDAEGFMAGFNKFKCDNHIDKRLLWWEPITDVDVTEQSLVDLIKERGKIDLVWVMEEPDFYVIDVDFDHIEDNNFHFTLPDRSKT